MNKIGYSGSRLKSEWFKGYHIKLLGLFLMIEWIIIAQGV